METDMCEYLLLNISPTPPAHN